MPPKRYVLLDSQGKFVAVEEALGVYLEQRYGRVKLIPVQGNPQGVIVRTTAAVAARLKEHRDGFVVEGNRFTPVLTSGAIGNLKRRATRAKAIGQVPE
jgi:hypothetical protein